MADRFIVLTWHAIRVLGHEYGDNDPVAFSEDLGVLHSLGFQIWPLGRAYDALLRKALPERVAVLCADDGVVLDFEDFVHPVWGPQRSLYRRLLAFERALPSGHPHQPHISSFVIASPQARDELDRTDYQSLGLWHQRWWRPATESGRIRIENHSWDHNHASLARTCQRDNRKGDFSLIDTEPECRAQIDQASDYIEHSTGRRPRFLAYPYGQTSDYLRREYLPKHADRIGLDAALSCEPGPVLTGSDRWFLPRYVCARDWRSPEEFARLLKDAV